MKRRDCFKVGGAMALALVLAWPAGSASAAPKTDLIIMSSVIGGIGFTFSSAVGGVLQQKGKFRVTLEATPGYVDNAKRLAAGFGDLGITAHDTARAAVAKREPFQGAKRSLVALVPIHQLDWNIVVRADGNTTQISQLNGKRVNLQPKGSSSEKTGASIMEALGYKITPSYHRHSEAAQALRTGQIDAHFMGGSNPVWQQFHLSTPLRVLSFTQEELNQISSKLPHLSPSTFEAGKYYKGAKAVSSVVTWAILMATREMDDETAYTVTKLIHENKDFMVKQHRGAEVIGTKNALHITVPIHPGAARYYKEKGVSLGAAQIAK